MARQGNREEQKAQHKAVKQSPSHTAEQKTIGNHTTLLFAIGSLFVVGVLIVFVLSRNSSSPDDDVTVAPCSPKTLGFGAHGFAANSSAGVALLECDVALLRGALSPKILAEVLEAFLHMPADEKDKFRYGNLRENRGQWHLPFSPPFDKLELLGAKGELQSALGTFFGPQFALDVATVVTVPPGAKEQGIHRDSLLEGVVGAHIPLHAIDEDFGPTGICAGSANTSDDYTGAVMRESLMWRQKGETKNSALQRIHCGGRQQTQVLHITFVVRGRNPVKVTDSRLGVVIRRFETDEALALDWQVGDEITHVNEQRITTDEQFKEIVKKTRSGDVLEIRVERPLPGPLPEQERRAIAAPLSPGDVFVYNGRAWHWGTENRKSSTRYSIFINYKTNDSHEGVHPEAKLTAEVEQARKAFQRKLVQLRDNLSSKREL